MNSRCQGILHVFPTLYPIGRADFCAECIRDIKPAEYFIHPTSVQRWEICASYLMAVLCTEFSNAMASPTGRKGICQTNLD